MKHTLLTLAALTAASIAVAQDARGGKLEWRTDVDQALKEALRDKRPVMLYVTDDN